jgi:hypothetical protein
MGLAVSKIGAAFAVNAWFMVAVGASPVLAQQPKFSSPETIPGRVCRNLQDNFVITVPDGYAATFLAEGNGGAIYRFRRSAEVEFRLIKRPARVGGAGLHRLRAEIEQRTRGHPETAGTLREWRQELPAGTARVFAYKRRVGPGTGSQQTQVVIDYAIAKGNALWLLRFPVRDFHYPQAKIRGSFFCAGIGQSGQDIPVCRSPSPVPHGGLYPRQPDRSKLVPMRCRRVQERKPHLFHHVCAHAGPSKDGPKVAAVALCPRYDRDHRGRRP